MARKTGNVLHHGGGWQIVPKEHSLKIGIKPEELADDGTRVVGDVVLFRIPKDLHNMKV